MSELIDREAVIDLLKKMRKDGDMVPWEGKDVFARIRKLPTIQPEERTEKRTETHGVCLDAISRKPAIDALDKQIKQCCKALGSLSLSDVDKHAVEVEMASLRAYREMLENLPTVQPEPQWIPVEREFPEDYTDVLVWFEYFRYGDYNCLYQTHGIGTYVANYNSWTINHESGWKDLRVIAWMPLPKPFEGGIK